MGSRWLWKPRVPGDSGKRESRVTHGTRSSRWLREPWFRVIPGDSGNTDSGRLRETVVPGDSWNPEFEVTSGTRNCGLLRNPEFRVTPGSGNLPADSGNTDFHGTLGARVFVFKILESWKCNSGNSEFRVIGEPPVPETPSARISISWVFGELKLRLRETRIPGKSTETGVQEDYFARVSISWVLAFRVNPGTRCSGEFGNPDSGWFRQPVVPGDSWNPEFLMTQAARIFGFLREPGDPSDTGNPEFHLTPGTWSSGWLREPGVPG